MVTVIALGLCVLGSLAIPPPRFAMLRVTRLANRNGGLAKGRLGRNLLKIRPGDRVENIRCFANLRRLSRVGKEIQREFGDMLLHDRNVLKAVDPKWTDDIVNTTLVSVTEVQMSRDMSVAKLYLLFSGGNPNGYHSVLNRLDSRKPYIRRALAERLNLRRAPEIVFYEDNTLQEADEMKKILSVLREDREKREAQLAEHGLTMESFLSSNTTGDESSM
ncbi:hypothetical protein AAMO2058_001605900 [Amorphochlora amoebiformis]